MSLGQNILNLRKKNGLSQEALGEKVNVTRQTISNWELEYNTPNAEQLKLLSMALNTSVDDLIDNDIQNVVLSKVKITEKQTKTIKKILKGILIGFISILIIDIISFIICFTGKIGPFKENKNDNNNLNGVINSMKIIINDKEYIINLENNETTNILVNMLPFELEMNDLNNNEKYAYLDTSLPTNSYSPKQINKGDVMLFKDNCLVIFYKTFNTSYSYTKIGNIDNLPDLGTDSISVNFKK